MNDLSSKNDRFSFLKNHCHVWLIDIIDTSHIHLLDDIDLLSYEEKEKLYSFRFRKDQLRYLVSHVSLRKIIHYYTDIPIHLIKFQYNEYGKPYIDNNIQFPLYFNLSHAHNKAVIVINNTEVGVDIEYIRSSLNIYELSKIIFSESEYREFLDLNHHDNKLSYFYTIWTKKEAYLKALSIGLIDDLKSISVNSHQKQSKIDGNFVIQSIDTQCDKYVANLSFKGGDYKEILVNNTKSHLKSDKERGVTCSGPT